MRQYSPLLLHLESESAALVSFTALSCTFRLRASSLLLSCRATLDHGATLDSVHTAMDASRQQGERTEEEGEPDAAVSLENPLHYVRHERDKKIRVSCVD